MRLKLINNTSSSAICTGPQSIDPTIAGNLIQSYQVNTSFINYTFTFNSIGNANPYLTIANIPVASAGQQTIEISSITITESAPAPSFTLPASITIACGSTASQTFTITNANNTTGITGYTWQLSASSNIWKDVNGNTVGNSITTTTGSLTLVPVCINGNQTISATVAVGASNYTTNTETINIGAIPPVSIIGPDVICSSESYSIPNFPCGATVEWSSTLSPSLINFSCTSCTQTTVNKAGSSTGTEWLTATITSCGQTVVVTKKVRVGAWDNYASVILGPSNVCVGSTSSYSVDLTNYPGLSNFSWTMPSGWSYITSGSNYVVIKAPSTSYPPTGSLILNASSCGAPFISSKFIAQSNCTSFRLSPNPANDYVSITEIDDSTGVQLNEMSIQKVEIVNKMGIATFTKEYKSKNYHSLKIPVGNLRNDVYTIRIFDGLKWKSHQLMIKR